MGIDMFVDSRTEQGLMFYFGQTFGILIMLLFGSVSFFCLLLLVKSKKGLVFTAEGFKDFSCFGMGKIVLWNEVEDISRFDVYGYKYVKVHLKEPDVFISSCSGILKFAYMLNHKLYGTPLFISSIMLKSNFDDLLNKVQIQWSTSK